MNEIVGYCTISKNAKTGLCVSEHISSFIGKDVRVLEFTDDGDVLVVNSQGTGIATFDKCDVYRSFKCIQFSEVLMPPDLNEIDKMLYYHKVMTRKGGYNNLLKNMVIQASLMKGVFNDGFLFSKQ